MLRSMKYVLPEAATPFEHRSARGALYVISWVKMLWCNFATSIGSPGVHTELKPRSSAVLLIVSNRINV